MRYRGSSWGYVEKIAEIRMNISFRLKGYLEFMQISLKDFSMERYKFLGYERPTTAKNALEDILVGRRIGEREKESGGRVFKKNELIKYGLLLKIIGVPYDEPFVVELGKVDIRFEYGGEEKKKRLREFVAPPTEIIGTAQGRRYRPERRPYSGN